MNEVVKYNNYLNTLRLKGFGHNDLNMFMALCSRMKGKGTEEMNFDFDEIKEITKYTQTSNSVFINDLRRMNRKLMSINCEIEKENIITAFVLFPTFEIDTLKQTLSVSVNEKFIFVLNDLIGNFTRFELEEFVSLESKYSKSLYRLLKQFRGTGTLKISVEDFREKMDVPDSYSNKYIMDKIIKPSMTELENVFKNLICNVIKAKTKGAPVIAYEFTYGKEVYEKPKAEEKKKVPAKKKNAFTNYPQRDYDYDDLERQLLK